MASPPHFYSSLSSLRRFLHPSPSPPSPAVHRTLGGAGGGGPESVAYRRSMLRAPPTVRVPGIHRNSCSFIGTVVAPVRRCGGRDPKNPWAYTFLEVFVMDLNYVRRNDQKQTSKKHEVLVDKELTGPTFVLGAFDSAEKHRERIYLWHVFFANPYEWWDNRRSKLNTRHPDFKHKGTGEVLWLNRHDPPWVKKQLELYDSKMDLGTNQRNGGRQPELHGWIIEDFE